MNELAERREPQAVTQAQGPTPAHMLQTAIEKGMTPEMIKEFMDLEERYRRNEAKKAYDAAVAAFHENPPHVTKDKDNKQYNSKYTSLGNLVNTVSEAMGKHGLHASWKVEQPDGRVKVTCILAHTLGHSESVSMEAPPDTSGQKNPIQQIKSTVTYLRGATFEAVTGVASDDSAGVNLNDDGNGSSPVAEALFIDEKQQADLDALISEVGADKPKFLRYLKVESLDRLEKSRFPGAVKALEAKRGTAK